MTAPKRDRLLSAPEVAEMTSLNVQSLYNRRLRGDRPYGFKLGGRVVFRESEVLDWINTAEQTDEARRAS